LPVHFPYQAVELKSQFLRVDAIHEPALQLAEVFGKIYRHLILQGRKYRLLTFTLREGLGHRLAQGFPDFFQNIFLGWGELHRLIAYYLSITSITIMLRATLW
jgi:hypothetical protein